MYLNSYDIQDSTPTLVDYITSRYTIPNGPYSVDGGQITNLDYSILIEGPSIYDGAKTILQTGIYGISISVFIYSDTVNTQKISLYCYTESGLYKQGCLFNEIGNILEQQQTCITYTTTCKLIQDEHLHVVLYNESDNIIGYDSGSPGPVAVLRTIMTIQHII